MNTIKQWQLEFQAAPMEQVNCELLKAKSVRLRVLRLDKIHTYVQGNKWFKLRLNLESCLEQGFSRVISFGGAYSNHLYALAAVGGQLGIETIGVIRGELVEPLNPVLAYCRSQGMKLYPVSRSQYRQKSDPQFLSQLQEKFGPAYVVPEGGSNRLGMQGCEEIAHQVCAHTKKSPVTIALACGTGTTLAGVVYGLSKQTVKHSVLGVSVLKAQGYIEEQVKSMLSQLDHFPKQPWYVSDSFHCGGYARSTMELNEFMEGFIDVSEIPLEPVYTGKLFFGVFSMIEADAFPPGSDIVVVHSGGIIPTHD